MKSKFKLNHLHKKCILNIANSLVLLGITITLLSVGMKADLENARQVAKEQRQQEIIEQVAADYRQMIEEREEAKKPTSCYTPSYNQIEPEEKIMYVDTGSYHNLNVRELPNANSDVIGTLQNGSEVTVLADASKYTSFARIAFEGGNGYIHSDFISESQPEIIDYFIPKTKSKKKSKTSSTEYNPQSIEYALRTTEYNQVTNSNLVLNSYHGTVQGPSGKETYYNLNMNRIVQGLKNMGIPGEYWVREDGVKCYGPYVMVAANLNVHPRGSLVQTSVGIGISCDTGTFAKYNPTQIDIATAW